MITKYNGAFSKDITTSNIFQKYASSTCVNGYIGSSARKDSYDKIVEEALRAQGLGPEGIAFWLTSVASRHLMDDPGRTLKEFKERTQRYTEEAYLQVAAWGHPDFDGSLNSTLKIQEKLKQAAKRR